MKKNSQIDVATQHPITEEDTHYYTWVFTFLQHVDPKATLMVRENDERLIVHITPKNMDVRQELIYTLLALHRKAGVRIEFSKSLAVSKKISYFINKLTPQQEQFFVSLSYG